MEKSTLSNEKSEERMLGTYTLKEYEGWSNPPFIVKNPLRSAESELVPYQINSDENDKIVPEWDEEDFLWDEEDIARLMV
jgi:hypothetical protein